jgi:hypothetical protein
MRSSMRPASRSILSCASIGCSWRRLNLDGRPSLVFHLPGMQPGDLPVAGHWTGGLKAAPDSTVRRTAPGICSTPPKAPPRRLPAIHFGSPGAVPLPAFSTALSEGRLFAGRWKTVRPALQTNRP